LSKTNYYVQCALFLRGDGTDGTALISWIPEKYAVKGKPLKLKNRRTGEWVDGWVVQECWGKEKAALVESRERSYLHQREMSDI